MARIVLTSFGSDGDVNPFLGLAAELRARGHHPLLALPPAYRSAVEREGLSFHPVRPDVDIHDRAFAARIMDPARGADVIFGEVLIPSLEQTAADLHDAVRDADLLVTHPTSLTGPTVAQERGIPWISTVLAPMSFFSVSDPIVPAPAPWMHALTSRSTLASRAFRRQTERITRKWSEPVQEFRVARGLPPGDNPILEGQHSPYRVLGLFSRLLGPPQRDWPAGTRVTGAILHNGPGRDTLSADLEGFIGAGDPPLVFTLGTSAVAAAGSFYEVSAEAARQLGRRAVLLAGRHEENRQGAMGSEVFVTDFARHAALFPRAAAIIHQGGAGTLHQALHSGRPMLVVPHAHDQPDNAYRARRLGVARILAPQRYRVARLTRDLRLLLEDPAYAGRAEEVADIARGEPGVQGAADAVEEVLCS